MGRDSTTTVTSDEEGNGWLNMILTAEEQTEHLNNPGGICHWTVYVNNDDLSPANDREEMIRYACASYAMMKPRDNNKIALNISNAGHQSVLWRSELDNANQNRTEADGENWWGTARTDRAQHADGWWYRFFNGSAALTAGSGSGSIAGVMAWVNPYENGTVSSIDLRARAIAEFGSGHHIERLDFTNEPSDGRLAGDKSYNDGRDENTMSNVRERLGAIYLVVVD